ncbi:MAG: lytic transglycosylase domain-containing protein [Cyanobacteria bacterium P01_H01_bin.74]
MALEHLQATLDRIASIQQQLETYKASGFDGGFSDGIADRFQSLLFQPLINNDQAAANTTESPGAETKFGSTGGTDLDAIIQQQAKTFGLDDDLLKAMIHSESGFNANAVSPVGAEGLMQLMPSTATELGVKNSFDTEQNIAGGSKYIKSLLNQYDQSLPKALAAYNAGPGNVEKYQGIPPFAETQHYVKTVMARYQQYQQQSGGL